MATYTVSSKITWAELGQDRDPKLEFITARSNYIDLLQQQNKTDGVWYADTNNNYPNRPCFVRDFVDQASADDYIAFMLNLTATLGWNDRILEATTIPTPSRP